MFSELQGSLFCMIFRFLKVRIQIQPIYDSTVCNEVKFFMTSVKLKKKDDSQY